MRRPTPLLSAFGGDEDDDKPRALKKLSYTAEELAAAQVCGRPRPAITSGHFHCAYIPICCHYSALPPINIVGGSVPVIRALSVLSGAAYGPANNAHAHRKHNDVYVNMVMPLLRALTCTPASNLDLSTCAAPDLAPSHHRRRPRRSRARRRSAARPTCKS